MSYDVTPEVLAEDQRIRELQDQRDREWLQYEEQRATTRRALQKARALGIYDPRHTRLFTESIVSKIKKIDAAAARLKASESFDEVMQVYKDLLKSDDEKIRMTAAKALQEMMFGKPGTQPPPEDTDRNKPMIVSSLQQLAPEAFDDEDDEDE